MKRIIFSMILYFFIISCSTQTEKLEIRKVSISNESKKIIVYNGTSNKIYYFAVESKMAAVIDWSPSLRHHFIESGKSANLAFSEILNGSDEPVKDGDRIIVYWWNKYHYENNDLNVEYIIL